MNRAVRAKECSRRTTHLNQKTKQERHACYGNDGGWQDVVCEHGQK